MSTATQIKANQANAQHSTGAKTEAGKAASAVNNRKQGFTGAFFVLPNEDKADFHLLFSNLETEHKPATPTEEMLVLKMAQHYWTSQRALNLQDGCLLPENNDNPNTFRSMSLFLRYQTTHDRAFHQCLSQLLKLRAEKRKERLDEAALAQRAEVSKIGFESQKANEARKQEAHEAKIRVQTSKAEWNELNTEIKGTIEARLPGHTAIPFEDLKAVLTTSIHAVMAEKERIAASKAA